MRINRYLASCGIASRRKSEQYIIEGRVKVNGKTVKDLSCNINDDDIVTMNGKQIKILKDKSFLFHKPRGYMVSHSDPYAKNFIYDLLPNDLGLFAAGRLDVDSEGLLFVSNMGKEANLLIHPSINIEKEYWVIINKILSEKDRIELISGVEGKYDYYKADEICFLSDEKIPVIKDWPKAKQLKGRKVKVVIHEGKKREVRRLFASLGYKVERLVRVRIGSLFLDGIEEGKYRELTSEEIDYINSLKED